MEDVEKHWKKMQHGVAEGSLIEHVRLQSWGVQSFGERPVYWIVVEEGGQGEGKNKGWGLGGSEAKRLAED